MKQHIIPEQLNELSEKGKKKLRKWWNKNPQDKTECLLDGEKNVLRFFKWSNFNEEFEFSHVKGTNCRQGTFLVGWAMPDNWEFFKKYKPVPLLSIGQMIEFLDEKWHFPYYWFIESEGYIKETTHKWNVVVGGKMNQEDVYKGNSKELCDALWKAVKEVLEK